MQVVTTLSGHISVAWKVTEEECTCQYPHHPLVFSATLILKLSVIILCSDSGSHMILNLCNELLRCTGEEIKKLDENPADYLYSYFRQSLCISSIVNSENAHRFDLHWMKCLILLIGVKTNRHTVTLFSLETIYPDLWGVSSSGGAVL
jgi:hypothetical protein